MAVHKYIITPEMSNRFYLIRKALNKSQKQMGPAIGYSQSMYSKLESSPGGVVEEKLILLMCSSFDVNYDYLVNGEGPMFNSDNAERRAWISLYDELPKPFIEMMTAMSKAFIRESKTKRDDLTVTNIQPKNEGT